MAVDGEGVDRPDGTHDYVLLSVGSESLFHPNGRRLTTDEIFEFLHEQHQAQPNAAFVGYFLGYDFAHWLRDLPEERARMLLLTEGMAARQARSGARAINPTPFPVRWGPWEFDLLPNLRRFKLRLRETDDPWLWVCDAGTIFQTSLVKAIDPAAWPEPICTPDEYQTIVAGKAARGEQLVPHGTRVDRTTIAYNRLENDVLPRLMSRVNEGLTAAGIRLTKVQWHGPGQAAQAWLRLIKAPTGDSCRATTPDYEDGPYDAARRSYFGGWFEVMAHGLVDGEVFEYDINSAYPSIIARLPCLLHGQWVHGTGAPPRRRAAYRLVCCAVTGSDAYVGAMPHRTPQGGVLRPHQTAGWYWQHELDAARRAGLVDRVRWEQWWEYQPCDCAPPLRTIADLYSERLKAGKNSPHGKALKLVYNSTYGKTAQSIGQPIYGNSVYASLITAGCRAMILDAIATHPRRSAGVVMVATDGVYFNSPHPTLPLDPAQLGAWDTAVKTGLSIFKPGVYWDDATRERLADGGKLAIKSRGVDGRALGAAIDQIDAQWRSFSWSPDPSLWPSITLSIPFTIVSPRQALRRNQWQLCGHVEHGKTVEQRSAPHPKRSPQPPDALPLDASLRSRPYAAVPGQPRSTPYAKEFGVSREQEDDWPMTIEGDYGSILAEIFGG